jgi:hypothetical protein
MSQTFTLKGRSHILESNFTPPLELDPRYDYSLALISLNTWNSIPNIEPGLNKFYYKFQSKKKVLEIPTGSYELEDIENYIQKRILDPEAPAEELSRQFSLKPNNNTLKCELKSVFEISFEPSDSIGSLLGFSKRVLKANTLHESDLPVNIIQVTTIRVECNIISGTYYANNRSHTLYEFSPTVDPGFSINIEPRNLIYLPVNRQQIDNITLTLLDQNSKPINFRGEEIVIRLELKHNGSGIR